MFKKTHKTHTLILLHFSANQMLSEILQMKKVTDLIHGIRKEIKY